MPVKPLSGKALAGIVVGIALLTAAVVTALWWAGTRGLDGPALVTARFDALKIGLSIGVGGGGVFALYLAWRRQRATEDTLAHQQEVAADTRADATERRITELYTRAAEQLGSDKAPVRLAGLYALERLAQDNPRQRQTIVNVLCAYLRMPFDPGEGDGRREEREVRRAAQRILATHLRPGADTHWPDTDLDLTGATLVELDFYGCRPRAAVFTGARFHGFTDLAEADFPRGAQFDRARFHGLATFADARFHADADFGTTEFHDSASFNQSHFHGYARFSEVHFHGGAGFGDARFHDDAGFRETTFHNGAWFDGAHFHGDRWFDGANFHGECRFDGARFDLGVPDEVAKRQADVEDA